MNYKETLDFLYRQLPMFQRIGAAAYKADLSQTLAVCTFLGNPEKKFPSIHIAGTNGKGSTAHMLASVLMEAGYKTGLYTSPHLRDFRERIRINGRMIPREAVREFVNRYQAEIQDIKPSFFEITFGMAMEYFALEAVDIAVVETGMGGRLDSTNVVRSVLTVITNISRDHTQFLGDDIAGIAAEKAGIIKAGVPLVVGRRQPETAFVFEQKAREMAAPLYYAGDRVTVDNGSRGGLLIQSSLWQGQEVMLPLAGDYQRENVATALAALDVLSQQQEWRGVADREVQQAGLEKVLANTGLAGRWQQLHDRPRVICDTGHNEDGISRIVNQLENETFQKLHFVLGMVNDKAIDRVLSLLPRQAEYYFCKADIPRGMDAGILKQKAAVFGLRGRQYPSVAEAYAVALSRAAHDDLVFVGGSTFVVAEVV